jgi:dihydroflavonol-4-reductase
LNLVTGATGQIGTVLVQELCKANEIVRVLVRRDSNLAALEGLPLDIVVGDILDPESLFRAMQGVTCVFHLAGLIPTRPGADNFMMRVNAEGTRNVCAAALKSGVNKLLYTSTVHIFNQKDKVTEIDETTPLALDSAPGTYHNSKVEATLAVLDAAQKGLNAVVICPSGVIGVNNHLVIDDLAKALLSFASGRFSFIVKGAFDFVDVRDLVSALVAARSKGKSGELYIVSGTRVTIKELHLKTQQVAGVSAPYIMVPDWLAYGGVYLLQRFSPLLNIQSGYNTYTLKTLKGNTFYSSQKATRELGYHPRPLETSIRDCLTNNQRGELNQPS